MRSLAGKNHIEWLVAGPQNQPRVPHPTAATKAVRRSHCRETCGPHASTHSRSYWGPGPACSTRGTDPRAGGRGHPLALGVDCSMEFVDGRHGGQAYGGVISSACCCSSYADRCKTKL